MRTLACRKRTCCLCTWRHMRSCVCVAFSVDKIWAPVVPRCIRAPSSPVETATSLTPCALLHPTRSTPQYQYAPYIRSTPPRRPRRVQRIQGARHSMPGACRTCRSGEDAATRDSGDGKSWRRAGKQRVREEMSGVRERERGLRKQARGMGARLTKASKGHASLCRTDGTSQLQQSRH